jgi:hypothetical protein
VLADPLWEVVLQELYSSDVERTKAMQHDPHSRRVVFDCSCGEKMVIFGQVEDWLPRDPVFRCACGERLTFSEDAKEQYYTSRRAS